MREEAQAGGEQRVRGTPQESGCFSLEVPGEEDGEYGEARKSGRNLHELLAV